MILEHIKKQQKHALIICSFTNHIFSAVEFKMLNVRAQKGKQTQHFSLIENF